MSSNLPSRPAAAATGRLEKTPIVNLVVYMFERNLTGTLELSEANGATVMILFVDGRPSRIRTSLPVAKLGAILVEMGALSTGQVERAAIEAKATGMTLGQKLRTRDYISAETLDQALIQQHMRRLRYVFAMPKDTLYAYYDGYDAFSDSGDDELIETDPFTLIVATIREKPPWEQVAATLAQIGGSALRLSRSATIERFQLSDAEGRLIDELRSRPLTLNEMARTGILRPKEVQLLVYCLLITQQLRVVTERNLALTNSVIPGRPLGDNARTSQLPPAPAQTQAVRVANSASSVGARQGVGAEPSPRDVLTRSTPAQTPPPRDVLTRSTPAQTPPARDVLTRSAPAQTPPARDVLTRSTPAQTPPPRDVLTRSAPAQTPPARDALTRSAPTSSASDVARRAEGAAFRGANIDTGPAEPQTESTSAVYDERRRDILKRASDVDTEDYFRVLSVDMSTGPDEIRARFFELAREWHPDKLPASLSSVKDHAAKVFARMSKAHAVLTDPKEREAYIKQYTSGAGSESEQHKVASVLEAVRNFQKAEIFFKRSDMAQAEHHCRLAYEADPQPDYAALLAWLDSLKDENQPPHMQAAIADRLSSVIKQSPRCERAYFFRGHIHKRLGKDRSALADFTKAVDLNPRNIDAAREVRLFQMRTARGGSVPPPRDSKPDSSASGGLFGKLFKK